MPPLFSCDSLQQEDVQLSTFGRRLDGHPDDLPRFEASRVRIDDQPRAARLGRTHHANVTFNGKPESLVARMAFEITQAEIASIDAYERAFSCAPNENARGETRSSSLHG
jgi:hypothetical protein